MEMYAQHHTHAASSIREGKHAHGNIACAYARIMRMSTTDQYFRSLKHLEDNTVKRPQ